MGLLGRRLRAVGVEQRGFARVQKAGCEGSAGGSMPRAALGQEMGLRLPSSGIKGSRTVNHRPLEESACNVQK